MQETVVQRPFPWQITRSMANVNSTGRSAIWTGLLITVLGALSNFLYFINPPAQSLLPWINFIVPAIGLLIVLVGLRRVVAQRRSYGVKILGGVFALVCLALAGGSTLGFFHARDIPESSGAPRPGQKAPDFALADSSGQTVLLSRLLSKPAQGDPPKAVLLVFYRGFWSPFCNLE